MRCSSCLPILGIALLTVAGSLGCQRVENPGPWHQPLKGGVLNQTQPASEDTQALSSAASPKANPVASLEKSTPEPATSKPSLPQSAAAAPPASSAFDRDPLSGSVVPSSAPSRDALDRPGTTDGGTMGSKAADQVVDRWSTDPVVGGLISSQDPVVDPSSLSVPGAVDPNTILPPAPPSDRDALAALEQLSLGDESEEQEKVGGLGAGRGEAATPCPPGAPSIETLPLSELRLVRLWREGSEGRAELRGPDGRLHLVVRGDRIGREGGKVLSVEERSIVIGTIGFGLDGQPILVQEAVHLGR